VDSTCPAKTTTKNEDSFGEEKTQFPAPTFRNVLIGKTEYTLSMHEGLRSWNLTYHAFSAAEMSPGMIENYGTYFYLTTLQLISYQGHKVESLSYQN